MNAAAFDKHLGEFVGLVALVSVAAILLSVVWRAYRAKAPTAADADVDRLAAKKRDELP